MTTHRFSVNDLLQEARATLTRLTPQQAHDAHMTGALILDTRTETDREREGVIQGSIHTPLSVIQWVADPAPGYQHPSIDGFEQTLIVVCNEGYSSSMAAASLQTPGLCQRHRSGGRLSRLEGHRFAHSARSRKYRREAERCQTPPHQYQGKAVCLVLARISIKRKKPQIAQITQKKICVICAICGFFFFIEMRVMPNA